MVFWVGSQSFAWNYTTKSEIAPLKYAIEISNENVYRTLLKILLKMDVRIQIDSKSGLFKNESKSEIFSASSDAQESANWTTKNASQAHLLI